MNEEYRLKALYFDPWYITYSKEMDDAMSKIVELTLVTHSNVEIESENIIVKKYFFPYSERMNNNFKIKKILKGIEYTVAWRNIIKLVQSRSFDVFHIQWLLSYRIDLFFLKKIKSNSKNPNIKLIYTAHNAIPHVGGESAKQRLRSIYKMVDKIIVHGNATKTEITSFAPEVEHKIYIQKHGAFKESIIKNDSRFDNVSQNHKNKIENNKGLKLLFLGNIFYNKGADRLMEYWIEKNKSISEHLLIIAGSVREKTDKYTRVEEKFTSLDNVIYCNRIVSNEEHDYYFSNCDIVILPYRHASMSGVVFTASRFKKPILTTNVGCIPDYLIQGDNSIIVNNEDENLFMGLDKLLKEYSMGDLMKMGENLNAHINKTCSWDDICNQLIEDVYI